VDQFAPHKVMKPPTLDQLQPPSAPLAACPVYTLSDNQGLHDYGTFSPELTRAVPLFKGHSDLSFQTLKNAAPIILNYLLG